MCKITDEPTKVISFRVGQSEYDWLHEQAKKQKVKNPSTYLRKAIREHIRLTGVENLKTA